MAIDYNRQYVGARYVPQFFKNVNGSWDWAQGFQYEPLTIVRYGENSYTSKKLVPDTVGNPNMNPEYWANTGNYNGFIAQINNDIGLIKNDIDSIMNSLGAWKQWHNKKILLIGDSYGEYPNGGWGTPLQTYFNNCNIKCTISTGSGEGFINGWPARLKSIENIDSYTDCYFIGGYNDGDGDISSGVQTCATYCKEHNISMKIVCIGRGYLEYPFNKYILWNNIVEPYGVTCYWDCFKWFHSKSDFLEDLIHPTQQAEIRCAKNLFNLIMGGQTTTKFAEPFTNKKNWFGIVTFNGDNMVIESNAMNIALPEIGGKQRGRIDAPEFFMPTGNHFNMNLVNTDGKIYNFDMKVDAIDGNLSLSVINNSNEAVTQGNYTPIFPIKMVLPTLYY